MDVSENERVAQLEMKMLELKSQLQQKDDRIRELVDLLREVENLFSKMDFDPYAKNVVRLHSLMCLELAKHNGQALRNAKQEIDRSCAVTGDLDGHKKPKGSALDQGKLHNAKQEKP